MAAQNYLQQGTKVSVGNVAIQATANGTVRRVKEVANQALGRRNRRHDSTSILSRQMSRIPSPCDAVINTLLSGVSLSQPRDALQQPAKPVNTGNSGKSSARREAYNLWWLDLESIASRSAGNDVIPIPGGSTFARSQTSVKTPPEIPETPESQKGCRKSPRLADRLTTRWGTEQFSESKSWSRNRRYNATSNLSRCLSRIPSSPCDSGINVMRSAAPNGIDLRSIPYEVRTMIMSGPGGPRSDDCPAFYCLRRGAHPTANMKNGWRKQRKGRELFHLLLRPSRGKDASLTTSAATWLAEIAEIAQTPKAP